MRIFHNNSKLNSNRADRSSTTKSSASLISNEGGLTLVEILAVSLILAIMSALLFSVVGGIIRGKELALSQRAAARTAQYVLSRMTRELSGRMRETLAANTRGNDSPDAQQQNQQQNQGGQSTRRRQRRATLLGINSQNGKAKSDRIRFVTASALQEFSQGPTNYGLTEVEYQLEEDPNHKIFDTPDDGYKNLILVREEHPARLRNRKLREERSLVYPIAERVVSLNFRYLNRGSWQETWEDPRAQLPEAVEITLAVRGEDEQIEIFRTSVALRKRSRRRGANRP